MGRRERRRPDPSRHRRGGILGSALIRRLIRDTPHRVVNVDRLTYGGRLDSLTEVAGSTRYSFEHVSIRERSEIRRIFREHRAGRRVYLAAESDVDRSIDGPGAFLETSVLGTFVLLEAAREAVAGRPGAERERFRFLQVSTD